MFGSKQKNGRADSALEKQVYDKLMEKDDLETVLNICISEHRCRFYIMTIVRYYAPQEMIQEFLKLV